MESHSFRSLEINRFYPVAHSYNYREHCDSLDDPYKLRSEKADFFLRWRESQLQAFHARVQKMPMGLCVSTQTGTEVLTPGLHDHIYIYQQTR